MVDYASPLIFVHVTGYEDMGWVGDVDARERLFVAIRRAGYTLDLWTVDGVESLRSRLAEAPSAALWWPNAYLIPTREGGTLGLVEVLEEAGCCVVGSGDAALQLMRDKAACQRRLGEAGVPIPAAVVVELDRPEAEVLAELSPIDGPFILKPTTGQGSVGIELASVVDEPGLAIQRARAAAAAIGGPILVEQFLPGADLTFGVIGEGEAAELMITYYLVADRPPESSPLDREARLRPWGDGKEMVVVDEPSLRDQVEALAPRICAAIGVRDVTRVDGRVDDEGRLRIFDVNGMPALVFPEGVIVAQALACSPEEDAEAVFDRLVGSILASAERRR